MTNTADITQRLKQAARELGFTLAGVCPAVAPPGLDRFHRWLESGFAGEMQYLENRRSAYAHPRHVLEGVQSLLMLAFDYATSEPAESPDGTGKVARYAWGSGDYHDLIHERLKRLRALAVELVPGSHVRGVVDTAPLLEREFAQLAGLGWVGKHTLLINKRRGSWFFLAALLTDFEMQADDPISRDHCGTCRACLDACPTDAFPQPFVLDASRCISYATIEQRTPIAEPLRDKLQGWVFGCDICQEVCPWNRRAIPSEEEALAPQAAHNPLDLIGLFELDDEAFRHRFRRSPLWRPRRRGILRNAALVLGTQRCRDALPALIGGLNDAEPLVRDACEWALQRFENEPAASEALRLYHDRGSSNPPPPDATST